MDFDCPGILAKDLAVKAVFLSYYYPPLKAPRATQVARLVQHSRLPIAVVCAAEGAASSRPEVEVRVFPDRHSRWRRLAEHLLYLPDGLRPWAVRVARQVESERAIEHDDVLVTFGQPMSDHLAGLYLKRRIGMPWVAHFSDPWSDNPFHLPIPFVQQRLRGMEASVFAAADRILFTSQETVDLVMRKYPAAIRDKAEVLPHAFDAGAYGPAKSFSPGSADIVVRYVGNFYRQRNPRHLAEALRHLQRTCPEVLAGVRFELVGHWRGRAGWSGSEYGLPGGLLTLQPPVTYRESLDLMRSADMLLVIDAPLESSVFFPSKLVDYLGAGRPLLAMTPPGASARVVETAGGRLIDPYSAETAAADIAQALQQYRSGALAAPPATSLSLYDARIVSAHFDNLIRDLCPTANGSSRTGSISA